MIESHYLYYYKYQQSISRELSRISTSPEYAMNGESGMTSDGCGDEFEEPIEQHLDCDYPICPGCREIFWNAMLESCGEEAVERMIRDMFDAMNVRIGR